MEHDCLLQAIQYHTNEPVEFIARVIGRKHQTKDGPCWTVWQASAYLYHRGIFASHFDFELGNKIEEVDWWQHCGILFVHRHCLPFHIGMAKINDTCFEDISKYLPQAVEALVWRPE